MNQIVRASIDQKIQECLRQFPDVEVIEQRVFFSAGKCTVRLIVDYPRGGISVERCAEVNRSLAAVFFESYAEEDFTVEVNSPGLDRMLVTEKDFLRREQETIGVWLKEPFNGKSYFEGVCRGVRDNQLLIEEKHRLVTIPFSLIHQGKRIVTWR